MSGEAAPGATEGGLATLVVARVLGPHGLRGDVVCQVLTDFPERFGRTRSVLVGEPPQVRRVERQRLQSGRVVLKLSGIDDRTAAEGLRGALVRVPVGEAVTLPPGEYFWHQIIGLRVVDGEARELGRIVEVLATGSNDVYVVRSAERELLLPAIKDVVREIDLERGEMVVALLPGLGS